MTTLLTVPMLMKNSPQASTCFFQSCNEQEHVIYLFHIVLKLQRRKSQFAISENKEVSQLSTWEVKYNLFPFTGKYICENFRKKR